MFLGKLICGFLGFLISGGSFIGALLGVWIGHSLDRALSQSAIFLSSSEREALQKLFFETTFQLIGHLAKADGRVSEEEVAQTEALMNRMGLNPVHRQQAIKYFQQGTQADFDFDGSIDRFAKVAARNRNLSLTLLEFLISVALADGTLDPAEQKVLRATAAKVNMNAQQFEQLLQMILAQNQFGNGSDDNSSGQYHANQAAPRQDEIKQAYQALGVSEEIDDKGLKRAYRKLMSQHHPDKLIAKGVPDDMIKVATEKSQQIQAAYEMLKKTRPS